MKYNAAPFILDILHPSTNESTPEDGLSSQRGVCEDELERTALGLVSAPEGTPRSTNQKFKRHSEEQTSAPEG